MNDTAGLPPTFFLLACVAMVDVYNRIHRQKEKTAPDGRPLSPIEIYEDRIRRSTDHLMEDVRVFGCSAVALQRDDKQVSKAERCIYLGRAWDNPKSCLLMSLERRRFFTCRDVITDEASFPFKKAFQICREIPTRYEDGDQGETVEEAFVDGVQPDPLDYESFEVPKVELDSVRDYSEAPRARSVDEFPADTVPPDDTEDTEGQKSELQPSSQDTKEEQDATSLVPAAATSVAPSVEKDTARRLSYSSVSLTPGPKLRDVFEPARGSLQTIQEDATRTKLGTGDDPNELQARSSPAKFIIGATYDTIHGEPATIVENNADGDVQVVFPSDGRQYTVDKSEIVDLVADRHEALSAEAVAASSVAEMLRDPLDWIPMTYDGLLVPSAEFALAVDVDYDTNFTSPCRVPVLAQQHGGLSHLTDYHVALLSTNDLVGKVLADSIDLPKYHFGVKDHPLGPLCKIAMDTEFCTLCKKDVFGEGREYRDTDVGTMFILKAKSDAQGLLAKIKARLTVLGNQEKQDLLSYSPVMLLTTIRLMISLHCADLDVHFHTIDIVAAFVSAKATREIWVRLPKGFVPPGRKPGQAYRLNYNLYGTVDAPRAFYIDYFDWHVSIGFKAIHEDRCFLSIHRDGEFIQFGTHVDDSIVARKGDKLWTWYLEKLGSKYEYKEDTLKFALGMRFERCPKTGAVTIDQDAQIDKMVRAFNLGGKTRKASTPVASDRGKTRPCKADLPTTDEDKRKARLLPVPQGMGHCGFLQQTTYHEITYAVKVNSAYLKEWGPRMWEWLKHIMVYLKSKRNRKFMLRGGTPEQQVLSAYSDTDHITDVDTRRSISAYYVLCGRDIVAWRASFQTVVSHSSAESELISMDLAVRRVQALRWLFEKIGGKVKDDAPTILFVDCNAAITMAENPVQNHRNCHIHARYFYVRDLIQDGVVVIEKVDTALQLADLLCTFKSVDNFNRLMAIAKPQPE